MSLLEPLCFPGSALISRTICPLLPHTHALQTCILPKSLASGFYFFFLPASVCLLPSLLFLSLKKQKNNNPETLWRGMAPCLAQWAQRLQEFLGAAPCDVVGLAMTGCRFCSSCQGTGAGETVTVCVFIWSLVVLSVLAASLLADIPTFPFSLFLSVFFSLSLYSAGPGSAATSDDSCFPSRSEDSGSSRSPARIPLAPRLQLQTRLQWVSQPSHSMSLIPTQEQFQKPKHNKRTVYLSQFPYLQLSKKRADSYGALLL